VGHCNGFVTNLSATHVTYAFSAPGVWVDPSPGAALYLRRSIERCLMFASKRVITLIITFLAVGCGQIQPQGKVPLTHLPNMASRANRPSVYIETKYFYDLNDGQGQPTEGTVVLSRFRKLVEDVADDSTLFSEVTLDWDEPKASDLTIRMEYRSSVHFNDAISNPVGQLITLGVGPINATQRTKITATVLDGQGTELGTYMVEVTLESSLGPFALYRLYWERSNLEEWLKNMVRNIFQQMLDDKVITYP
jgi:hypothetical protein